MHEYAHYARVDFASTLALNRRPYYLADGLRVGDKFSSAREHVSKKALRFYNHIQVDECLTFVFVLFTPLQATMSSLTHSCY